MDGNNHKSTVSVAIATLSGEEGIGSALETNSFCVENNISVCEACNDGVKVVIRYQVSEL
jgi:hypothetical protein